MLARRTFTTACILTIILMIRVSAVAATDVGTIMLKTGEEYENVTCQVDYDQERVIVFLTGMNIAVGFDLINHIFDENGREVTGEVLRRGLGSQRVPEEGSRPYSTGVSDTNESKERQSWVFGLRLAGNYSIPSGKYYSGVRDGYGFEADVLASLSSNVVIRVSVSRSGLRDKDQGYVFSDRFAYFHAFRTFFAVQYNLHPGHAIRGRSFAYVYVGAGVIRHRGSERSWSVLEHGGRFKMVFGSHRTSETKLANTLGVGVMRLLTDNIGFDISAACDVVYARATILDSKLGLVAFF